MPKKKTKAQLQKERNRAAAAIADAKKNAAKIATKKAQELAEQKSPGTVGKRVLTPPAVLQARVRRCPHQRRIGTT
jgi:hypothetical protein